MKVRVSVIARRDIARLTDFLGGAKEGPARRALDAIEVGLQSLSSMADRGYRTSDKDMRQIFVAFGRSGYVIQYRVENAQVTVLRIFHGLEDRTS